MQQRRNVLRDAALIGRRRIGAQHHCAIGAHVPHRFASRANAHRQHGDEHADGARHADDDGAHEPETLRNAGEIHAEQGAELFREIHRYLPASASTTWSRAALNAGTAALMSATRTAPITPEVMTMSGMESPATNFAA